MEIGNVDSTIVHTFIWSDIGVGRRPLNPLRLQAAREDWVKRLGRTENLTHGLKTFDVEIGDVSGRVAVLLYNGFVAVCSSLLDYLTLRIMIGLKPGGVCNDILSNGLGDLSLSVGQ